MELVKKDSSNNWVPAPEEATKYPDVNVATLRQGDVLRKPDLPNVNDDVPHALLVLAKLPGTTPDNPKILVIDSNWIWPGHSTGGNGHEIIGTHIISLLPDPDNPKKANLSGYRDLDCVYAGTC